MKVRKREEFPPITLFPGDSLSVIYRDGGNETVLVEDEIENALTVDTALIVELEEAETRDLGLEEALGGIMGRKSK